MTQATCFCARRILFRVITTGDGIWGKHAQSSLKVGINRQFQTKRPKHNNRTISETTNIIKSKSEDQLAGTISCMLRVVCQYPRPIQRVDGPIQIKFGKPLQNNLSTATERTKLEPEIEFPSGLCLFSETASSNLSDLGGDILPKFGLRIDFELLHKIRNWKKNCDAVAAILKTDMTSWLHRGWRDLNKFGTRWRKITRRWR